MLSADGLPTRLVVTRSGMRTRSRSTARHPCRFTAAIDGCRGLDHGAWSPLLYMYPKHDIPVVQISVQPHLGPRHHVELGKAVRTLADEGVLIFGSGHLTHNLRDWGRGTKEPQPYAREFQEWVKQKLEQKDIDSLVDYRSRSPHGVDSSTLSTSCGWPWQAPLP